MSGKVSCSQRIRDALAEKKWKQRDLCDRTGIPKSAMSQYCNGSFLPKQNRLHDIAKALDVSEAWLMGYDVPKERGLENNALTLGALVAEYRRQNGLSVQQFAEISGLSEADISSLEDKSNQTAPPVVTYAAVEKATGMPLDKLMFLTASSKATPGKKTFELSEPEEQLITLFRRMPDEKQNALLLVASSMAEQGEQKENKIV